MNYPPIYLDHAATTPVDPLVKEAMLPYLTDAYGNPSSLHRWGKAAKKALEDAKNTLAQCLHTQPQELILTSGGTEADNLAILGIAKAQEARGRHIITSAIEHAAVLNPCQYLESQGWEVTYLPVDTEGFVSLTALEQALRPDTTLVSIMHGNNEIGTLQPIEAIGQLLRERSVLFHTDAVQTVGKLPLDLSTLPVDYLTLSSHKIYGPKGVGALYIRDGAPEPISLLFGGGQEGSLRSGTENLPGIVGFAKAMALSIERMDASTAHLQTLQRLLLERIEATLPQAVLNGPRDLSRRVPGNVHFSFPPAEGESLVLQLDLRGIAVSSGSACHSAVIEPSRVIQALGQTDPIARGTVRFTLGLQNTTEEIERTVSALSKILDRLSRKTTSSVRP